MTDAQARLLDKVTAASTAASAGLGGIKHTVILMQENRSLDHYFGTLSGVRGFSDPNVLKNANGTPIFDQYGYQPGRGKYLTGTLDVGIPYPLPATNSMAAQETIPPRPEVP